MAPVLGYWDIRGVAEPIRYLLHYAGVQFEDKRYMFGEGDNMLKGNWISEKYSLGLDLPNLPYYIDEDVKISQSFVILRYLARKHGLYMPEGNCEDVLKIEMVEAHLRDIFYNLIFIVMNPDLVKMRDMFKARAVQQLADLSKLLDENDWLMGEKLTHVDFVLYDMLDLWNMFIPGLLDGTENLKKYKARFAELPGVKEYLRTSKKWPIFAPLASWGGRGDPPEQ